MFSRNHILLLGFLIWISSCQNNQEEPVPGDRPVTFAPAIAGEEVHTRASNDSWKKDDRVGIYMIPHVASGSADLSNATAEATNVEYKTTSSGTSSDLLAVGNYIRYPLDNSQVNFIAYYPFNPDVHQIYNHIYPIKVGTQDPLTDIDLLYHNGTGTAYKRTPFETVSLEFTHQLSKLSMTIKPAADVTVDLTNAEVILTGFPTESTFDLSTGILGASSNPSTVDAPIVPIKDQTKSTATEMFCEAILIPNNGTEYTRTMTLKVGGDSYSYILPATFTMTPGTAYQYDFTFTGSRIVLAQNTIVNWNDGGTEEHTIGKDLPIGWDQEIDWTQPIVFGGPSNCYIVPQNTQLLIPINRAYEFARNTTYGVQAGHPVIEGDEVFYGEIYWQDANGVLASTDPITPCGIGPKGYLLVKTGSTDGNAVVAVQKKVNEEYVTLWSWHVWVTDYDPNTGPTFTNIYNTNNNGNRFVFMDRNLGATFAGMGNLANEDNYGTGLFYQWGRKDPFPATLAPDEIQPGGGTFTVTLINSTSGTVGYTIKNPNVFNGVVTESSADWLYTARDHTLWGHGNTTAKSIYDPCPVGWRVPSYNVEPDAFSSTGASPWLGFSNATSDTNSYTPANLYGSFSNGYTWGTSSANTSYPAPGYRNAESTNLLYIGECGYYWSASPSIDTKGAAVSLNENAVGVFFSAVRGQGFSVRCVKE